MSRPLRWSLGVLIFAAGCTRAPAGEICPRIDAGELVISELRGEQSDADTLGHYIELYNASGRTLDLQGVWIRVRAKDGSELGFFVREPVEVAAGGYATIGPGLDGQPSWLDYRLAWDIGELDDEDTEVEIPNDEFPTNLLKYPAGLIEVESCDALIDTASFDIGELPGLGTLACGNAEDPPDAAQNDDASGGCWCVDAQPPDQPLPGIIEAPGSPGEANRCP